MFYILINLKALLLFLHHRGPNLQTQYIHQSITRSLANNKWISTNAMVVIPIWQTFLCSGHSHPITSYCNLVLCSLHKQKQCWLLISHPKGYSCFFLLIWDMGRAKVEGIVLRGINWRLVNSKSNQLSNNQINKFL